MRRFLILFISLLSTLVVAQEPEPQTHSLDEIQDVTQLPPKERDRLGVSCAASHDAQAPNTICVAGRATIIEEAG